MTALRAVFWDVDGTLADTEMEGHRPAFNHAFRELGLPIHWNETLYADLLAIAGGIPRVTIYAAEQGINLTEVQLKRLRDVKREHYFSRIRDGHVRWRPGVVRVVNELHDHNVQQWIVTSSGSPSVQALLDHAEGVLPVFDGVVTSDDVTTGKPSPDGYRLALKRSGIDPSCGLAIEDSAVGLQAATVAGLPCLLTPSPWDKDLVEISHLATAVLNHLGDHDKPSRLQHGPPCLDGMVTLNYMQSLLTHSLS